MNSKLTIDEFYQKFFDKETNIWICPICEEKTNSRHFNCFHLKKKHNTTFRDLIFKYANCECNYCGNLNKDISFNKLRICRSTVNHTECIEKEKASKLRYCEECGNPIASFAKRFCSVSCSNSFRYKNEDFLREFKLSIKNSYTEELRQKRYEDSLRFESWRNFGVDKTASQVRDKHRFFDLLNSELENIRKQIKIKKSENQFKMSYQSFQEELFAYFLMKNNIEFIPQYCFLDGSRFIFDFKIDGEIIELDGSYYHQYDSDSDNYDILKQDYCIYKGLKVSRLNLENISFESNSIEKILDQIQEIWDSREIISTIQNKEKLEETLTRINSEIELLGRLPKPCSPNYGNHWKCGKDITKEVILNFFESRETNSVSEIYSKLDITHKVLQRIAKQFFNLSFEEFLEEHFDEN